MDHGLPEMVGTEIAPTTGKTGIEMMTFITLTVMVKAPETITAAKEMTTEIIEMIEIIIVR